MIFILVVFLFASSAYCLLRTRNICYFAPNVTTDNEKMVVFAHEINIWGWPSNARNKLQQKPTEVLDYFLALISRYVLRDKSDWGNVCGAPRSCGVCLLVVLALLSCPFTLFCSLCCMQLALAVLHSNLHGAFFITSVIYRGSC